ncbi:MAG TPA: polyphenol oxidase family protein [Chthoniobacteraceae bacterium]|nr:polyphenol oxidase family protein [Chthoniobacteraceae bacterium]
MNVPVEIFPQLSKGGRFPNAFFGRVPGLDVATEREVALARLNDWHREMREKVGFAGMPFITAQQVHGNGVAVVDAESCSRVAGVDALVTGTPNVCLGIYVADCGAVYAVDPVANCIGLAHSGRKGTELRIVPEMLRKMGEAFGSHPANVTVCLGPCIRPPLYEVDFAAEIVMQCREAGVGEVMDSGICTGSNPGRYYSYRMEKGKTGRLLALLAMKG